MNISNYHFRAERKTEILMGKIHRAETESIWIRVVDVTSQPLVSCRFR
jgi:hypothetical protein